MCLLQYFLYLLSCARQTETIDSIPIVNIYKERILNPPGAYTHLQLQLGISFMLGHDIIIELIDLLYMSSLKTRNKSH